LPGSPPIVWATALIDAQHTTPAVRRASGRALASQLLVAIGDESRAVDTDARGKPIVPGEPMLHVSIAHTRNLVAAAASAIGPVGIDIEYRNPDRDLGRLALAAFGPAECQAVAVHGVSAFYRIWTLREAISKATGDGMALVADRIDRVPIVMGDGTLVAAGDEWLVAHDVVAQDFSLALVVRVALGDARTAVEGCSLASLQFHSQAGMSPQTCP
jgi:phosphopantetheinyl transferase